MQTTTDEFLHALFSASDEHKSRALKILKGEGPDPAERGTRAREQAQVVEPYVTLWALFAVLSHKRIPSTVLPIGWKIKIGRF